MQRLPKLLGQGTLFGSALAALGAGDLERCGQARNQRCGLSAGAQAVLLTAAVNQRAQFARLAHIQEADALRPAELVGRSRQKIDAVQRDGQVSRSLHSVNVQQHIRLTAERCQRGDVLYNAYLVVGVLQADQVGVGRQGAGQALRYNAAEPVNLQRCHAAAVVPD